MAEMENTITVYRGDSWPFVVTLTDKKTGLPLEITSHTFKLTVDRKLSPTDATTKIFETTGTIVSPSAGTVRFSPTAENHATAGNFYYDIQMTNSSGNKKTLPKSQYIILQDITKT